MLRTCFEGDSCWQPRWQRLRYQEAPSRLESGLYYLLHHAWACLNTIQYLSQETLSWFLSWNISQGDYGKSELTLTL